MTADNPFLDFSPTTLADVMRRENVMDSGICPLWVDMPRVAGVAYTVRCPAGDNLMLHAAIHRAPPGSIIVVDSANSDYAVAGGNVCAVAQKRGIAAFIIDGAIRDVAEIRKNRFPVFARGVIPIPGGKEIVDILNNGAVMCGGVQVSPGDIVVADEEGIVVVPAAQREAVLQAAQRRADKDAAETLEAWETSHQRRIDDLLRAKGFTG